MLCYFIIFNIHTSKKLNMPSNMPKTHRAPCPVRAAPCSVGWRHTSPCSVVSGRAAAWASHPAEPRYPVPPLPRPAASEAPVENTAKSKGKAEKVWFFDKKH